MPDPTPAAPTGDTQQTQTTQQQGTQQSPQAGTQQTQGDQSTQGKATWGDTWRQDVSAGDEKVLKRLERYGSPKDVVQAMIAAQTKISSGEYRKPLEANATAEEVAQWRKDNGVPEKSEGYLDNLPQGLVIGDDDKEIFGSFAAELHKINADPKVAHTAIAWYNGFQEAQQAKQLEGDNAARTTLEDQLRTEWGADYRANINSMKGLLSQAPEGVEDAITQARAADGTRIIDQPAIVSWLVNMAREINPVTTLVPGAGGNQMQSLDGEIGLIEERMRKDRKGYNADEKMQERYRQLIDARAKLKTRAA